MRLATIKLETSEKLAVCRKDGVIPIHSLNQYLKTAWPEEMMELLLSNRFAEFTNWWQHNGEMVAKEVAHEIMPAAAVTFCPLYRHPAKIWGIGLNYASHAADLSEKTPCGIPASFLKPDTTIIGPGDSIRIPHQSCKTTAEAELGIVIAKRCQNVSPENWREVVAGFTTIIDMTAEDILRQNPRYLTLSKSFDTFFSFGPIMMTPDEVEKVDALVVTTLLNGKAQAENHVANMTFSPAYLVSFHSHVMTLLPGDIISTGTPGATPVKHGDTVACRISGFPMLVNPVVDAKIQDSKL